MNAEQTVKGKAADYLANERTFLSWIRTSIGIMAFGFVVVKFNLFIVQLSVLLGKETSIPVNNYSSIVGVLLVASGAFITVFAFFQYYFTQQHLKKNDYRPSHWLSIGLMIFMSLISVILVAYLILSIQ